MTATDPEQEEFNETIAAYLRDQGYAVHKTNDTLSTRVMCTDEGSLHEHPFRITKHFSVLIPNQYLELAHTLSGLDFKYKEPQYLMYVSKMLASKVSNRVSEGLAAHFLEHFKHLQAEENTNEPG